MIDTVVCRHTGTQLDGCLKYLRVTVFMNRILFYSRMEEAFFISFPTPQTASLDHHSLLHSKRSKIV